MEPLAVALAGLFQFLGLAVFFDQPQDHCSPAPSLASWIFLVATLCFLWDTNIYPCRFSHMSYGWQILVEMVAAVFLVELSAIVVWCGLERFLYSLLEEIFNVTDAQRCVPFALISWLRRLVSGSPYCKPSWKFYWLSGLITSSVSLAALWYVLQATDFICYVKRMFWTVHWNVRITWRMLRCYFAMNMAGRRRTLQVCQMAANRNRCARRMPTRNGCRSREECDDECDSD
ncbi:hypothetical protein KR054_000067 [Drosophila jambulina]|nr:hypothetical protein KR054_000067 [Drosophila jambulina]